MQIIHILGDDMHIKIFLKFHQSQVSLIGQGILQLGSPFVIKFQDELPCFFPNPRDWLLPLHHNFPTDLLSL